MTKYFLWTAPRSAQINPFEKFNLDLPKSITAEYAERIHVAANSTETQQQIKPFSVYADCSPQVTQWNY